MTANSDGVGAGATLTVALPTTTRHAVTASSVDSPARPRRPRQALNILLVEDHADTSQALAELLTEDGHRVRVVGGVEAAILEAASEPCDLLISDIGLPDGSGIDVIHRMRPAPTLGAIAMSGFGTEEDLLRTRHAGFGVHLTKPVDSAALERAIDAVSNARPRPDRIVDRQRRPGTSRSRSRRLRNRNG